MSQSRPSGAAAMFACSLRSALSTRFGFAVSTFQRASVLNVGYPCRRRGRRRLLRGGPRVRLDCPGRSSSSRSRILARASGRPASTGTDRVHVQPGSRALVRVESTHAWPLAESTAISGVYRQHPVCGILPPACSCRSRSGSRGRGARPRRNRRSVLREAGSRDARRVGVGGLCCLPGLSVHGAPDAGAVAVLMALLVSPALVERMPPKNARSDPSGICNRSGWESTTSRRARRRRSRPCRPR